MSFYAKVKKGINEAPYYGKFIYPDKNGNPTKLEDRYRSAVEKDSRLEIVEQKKIEEIKENRAELIKDIIEGQWKQSEKRINTITDLKFLEYELLPAIIKSNDESSTKSKIKLMEITRDKIKELTPGMKF